VSDIETRDLTAALIGGSNLPALLILAIPQLAHNEVLRSGRERIEVSAYGDDYPSVIH
jgi:hypothetical protein